MPFLRRALLLLATVLGCGDGASDPAIGFTYNWGDVPLENYIQQELDSAPGAAAPIRLLASSEGGWEALGSSPMAAEVRRATILAENPDVVVVVGPGGSREALQVAPVYAEYGMPVIVPTATSRLLDSSGTHLFRMVPNDSVQGAFIASFADSVLRVRRLSIFHVPDEYGIGLAAGITGEAAQRDMSIVERTAIRLIQPCGDSTGDRYYTELVAALAQRGVPDAVALAVRTQESACFIRALRLRWPALPVIVGDGTYIDEVLFRVGGPATEGMYLVAFWHPDLPSAASQRFIERYTRVAGRAPRHGDAVFTDAVGLAAAAIRDGARSRADLMRYLRELGSVRPPYDGITGPVSFAPGAPRRLYMTQVRGRSSTLLLTR